MRDVSVSSRVVSFMEEYATDPNTSGPLQVTCDQLYARMVEAGILSEGDRNAVSAILSTLSQQGFIGIGGRDVQSSGRRANVYVIDQGILDYNARGTSSSGGNGAHPRSGQAAGKFAGRGKFAALPEDGGDPPRPPQLPTSDPQGEPVVLPDPVDDRLRLIEGALALLTAKADEIVTKVSLVLGGSLEGVPTDALMAELRRRVVA